MTKENLIKLISDLEDSISDKKSLIEDLEGELQADKDELEELEKKLEEIEYDEENALPDSISGNLYMYICTNNPLYLQFIQEELNEHEENTLDEYRQTVVDIHNIPLVLA